MKKILKALGNNYFYIIGLVFAIMANFQKDTNEFMLMTLLAVGCLILQKANDIISILEELTEQSEKRV